MPQWLASSLSEARKPDRAGAPVSGRRRRQESPILRGERDISRKAIAQGMSDRLRCPVCSCAIFFSTLCTRDRGCSAHPAFPAPSLFRGTTKRKPRASPAARTRMCICRLKSEMPLVLPCPHIPEQESRDLPLLDFLAAFGDAVAAVVAVDVFERLVARIAHCAMDLHGAVGGFAAQPVRPEITHRNLVGERVLDLRLGQLVHLPRRLADQ